MSTAPESGKPVALVTGAASGIGRATAAHLANDGYRIFAIDRDPAGLESVAAELSEHDVVCRGADLADPEISVAVIAEAVRAWGRLDFLALVAGIAQRNPATSITTELWDRVIDVNLRAPFLLAREAFPHLKATKGSIVAVSSIAGMQGWPYAAAYSASKGGLITLMRTLALEYGVEGVRVNVVSPGSVATGLAGDMRQEEFEIHEALQRRPGGVDGRVGTPDEIAAVIGFLASPAAGYVSGAVLRVDGGAFA